MKFKIGDSVWIPITATIEEKVTCSVCYGKKKVHLILGNDDVVALPCDYCSHGRQDPTGLETVCSVELSAESRIISGIESKESSRGTKVKYYFGLDRVDENQCYATQCEALKELEKLSENRKLEEETRAKQIKHNKNKNYAWNAGCHISCAEDCLKQIARHVRMAKL